MLAILLTTYMTLTYAYMSPEPSFSLIPVNVPSYHHLPKGILGFNTCFLIIAIV